MTAEYITLRTAAAALGVSVRRVRQLIAEGVLPAQKVGRDWLIRPEDMAAARRRNTTRGGPAGQRGGRSGRSGRRGRRDG